MKIRVLVVDDHTILRQGLRALLEDFGDVQVVGDAQNGEEALARSGELAPDVVLMDIMMPGMNGLEATRAIRQKFPQVRVLILTQYEDRQLVLSLLQAGASGYVLKRALGTDLVRGLRAVFNGQAYLDPSVATLVVDAACGPRDGAAGPFEPLTGRECEILRYIAQGKTNVEIAAVLCLSPNTVVWHRANLMSKLGMHKATDLVRYAVQNGFLGDDPA